MIGGRLFYRFSAFFLGHGLGHSFGHGISLRGRTPAIVEYSTPTPAEGPAQLHSLAFLRRRAALFSRPETAPAFPAYRPSMAITAMKKNIAVGKFYNSTSGHSPRRPAFATAAFA
jgi:hypothetical protein